MKRGLGVMSVIALFALLGCNEDLGSDAQKNIGIDMEQEGSAESFGNELEDAVTNIEINEGDLRIRVDQPVQLSVTVLPDEAKNKIVEWISDDPTIATIDSNGVLTPHNMGFTTINARATDGSNVSDTRGVEVYVENTPYNANSTTGTAEDLPAANIPALVAASNPGASNLSMASILAPLATTPAVQWANYVNSIPAGPSTYTVLIKTGTKSGAGTDSNIDLTLIGSKATSESVRLNTRIKGNAFENGDLDVVTLSKTDLKSSDLGIIRGITIKSDGAYAGSDWYIESVRVIENGREMSTFNINEWRNKGSLTKYNPVVSNISYKKPIYIIGHRANDLVDIDRAIMRGANAVECDIRYGSGQFYVSHDLVSPAFRDVTLAAWLNEAYWVSERYGDQFALIYFDLKDSEHLVNLIKFVQNHPISKKVNFIYSVAKLGNTGQFKAANDILKINEGLNVDMDDNEAGVANVYATNGISRGWYGNGIAANLLTPNSVTGSLYRANLYHRGSGVGKFSKTMSWTYEKKSSVQLFLDPNGLFKTDALIVNFGGSMTLNHMKSVLEGFHEFGNMRLATRRDNPFTAW